MTVQTPMGSEGTDEYLEELRRLADPLADEAVSALFAQHGIPALNRLWLELGRNDQVPPDLLPDGASDYLAASVVLPSWADAALIGQGEKFFERSGILCLVSLLCASLPECYALSDEAAVLGTTRNLEDHAYRRVFQTTQLIVWVMQEGGLGRGGPGVLAVQKVRLMHAAIRHLILNASGKFPASHSPKSFAEAIGTMPAWDIQRQGRPINQEQMVYTLLTFSYVILRAFRTMKIDVSEQEERAYLHVWNVVGFLMGIQERLLPRDFNAAESLFLGIKKIRMGRSPDGVALTAALVRASRQVIRRETDGLLARWLVNHLPPVIMRLLLDKKTLAVFDVEKLGFCEWLLLRFLTLLVGPFEGLYRRLVRALGARFGQAVLAALTQLPQGETRRLFEVPERLRASWKLKPPSR